jgi:opacity protein-like surface antigen
MKISFKLFVFLFSFLILLSSALSAQQLFFIFGHGVLANPSDKNFSNTHNSGIGVEGGAAIGWNKTFIVGTIGYSSFGSEGENENGSLGYAPLKAGLRQYLFSKLLYIHADVGIGKIKNDIGSKSPFSGDIGAGVKLGIFEAQLDYDGFTRSDPSGYASWIGIKAGINIGL